jgi:hypothetical protein
MAIHTYVSVSRFFSSVAFMPKATATGIQTVQINKFFLVCVDYVISHSNKAPEKHAKTSHHVEKVAGNAS